MDSGLNSTVLASNNEFVILPINEPTFGTPRKSQIQTYLEQNEGPGLQHLALKTDDIFTTLRLLRQRSAAGGFDFMPRASDKYYRSALHKVARLREGVLVLMLQPTIEVYSILATACKVATSSSNTPTCSVKACLIPHLDLTICLSFEECI